jgi:hypothetical protein
MRALIAVSLLGCTAACNTILGISDPKPAGLDDSGVDSAIDSNIDAPPPCTTSVSFKAEVSSEVGAAGKDFQTGRFDLGNLNEDIAIATGTNVVILIGDGAGRTLALIRSLGSGRRRADDRTHT